MRRTPVCTAWRVSPTAATRGRPTRAVRAWRACCRHRRARSTPAPGERALCSGGALVRASRRALALGGRGLGKAQIIRAAPARPLAENQVRVVTPSGTAVVARQRLAHVVALMIEVETQDRATHADVGRDVYQLVATRSEEHTSELQSPCNLVCRLLLEKKKTDSRRRRGPEIEAPAQPETVRFPHTYSRQIPCLCRCTPPPARRLSLTRATATNVATHTSA